MYFCQPLLLICIILILAEHSQSQNKKGPGISSCCFSYTRNTYCGLSEVLVTDIPEECTSLIYLGAFVDSDYQVGKSNTVEDDANLYKLLKSDKDVIIYYGRGSQCEWTTMLINENSNGGTNSLKEMKGLKTFLDNHPGIVGVILTGVQYQIDSSEFPTYTENFKTYLDVFKKTFPNMTIGLDLFGSYLMDQYTHAKFKWLDISVIDYAIDFYAVTTELFNDCNDDLKNTGTSPITSSKTNYTLDKLKDVLQQACIPIDKTYFKFKLNPQSSNDSLTLCDVNYEKMCTQPQIACDWCSDTQLSFNEKGVFSQKYGAGFMVRFIDYDDPNNCCKCEKPYPSFHAILDGFNGVSTKTCDLLKRP